MRRLSVRASDALRGLHGIGLWQVKLGYDAGLQTPRLARYDGCFRALGGAV